ncbi:MAG TPA: GspMb/PilO family protein [Gemmatimonadales bacterium]|nr:GspMb/PilO family protein [Gemmatimonadales bacterium]
MTPRDRRALVWGTGVLTLALLFGRLAPTAFRAWRVASGALAERTALLAREHGDLGGLTTLEDSAKVVEASFVALAPKLLTGGSAAEAIADLEGRITLSASRHRTAVIRLEPVPDSTTLAKLGRVRVTVQVESDWAGISEFLQAVNADPAALGVGSLDVTSTDPVASSARPEVLHAALDIDGWYLRAGGRS